MAPCEQVKLDEAQRGKKKKVSLYYPASIFIFQELFMGSAGNA